ncbi:MAG: rhamnan synthesis F family protein [Aestuariivirga sp.]
MNWIYGAEFDIRSYVKDFWAIALGKHKRPQAEYPGQSKRGLDRKKIAIVAIYPNSTAADFSIVHLLKSLQDCGFWVLVISTLKLSQEQREKFGLHCNHVIERHGIGRDFASYKMGWNWLNRSNDLKDAEYLVLANDRMFYPAGFSKHIRQIIAAHYSWGTLFENFERHYHSQSFFQIFGKEVFASKVFHRFWSSYWPFSTRAHAIDRGEVSLSSALLKGKFYPQALFRSDLISADAVAGLSKPNSERLVFAIKHALDLTSITARRFGDLNFTTQERSVFDLKSYKREARLELAQQIATVAEFRNPTHRIGVLCNVLYGAPLKRDLVYRGTFEIGTLLLASTAFSEIEKQSIRDDLVSKGSPQSLAHSYRLMSLYRSSRI